MWEEGWNSIIDGEPDDTAHHSDEYLAWYRGITRLRIGRGMGAMDASRNVVKDQSVVKVRAFVERVIASFGTIDENTGSTILYKVIRLVHSKLTKFHASYAAGFDKLDIEECLKDETNEAQQVKNSEIRYTL
ncbi:hypothetical protein MRB53_013571 [Persea americana]|uniref:Uncharacterized protein n=1 Tax=Persea americana TaxID=3435 RepID=A0ACC2K8F1_PERAE|nr:hypothetical protein MRB53_013571 [Persea americana]